ncbi:MAG: TrkA family potassium uptake protein [Bacteroidetes bacterium]|nr:TrkA family potassium uptake protein [Bacteroidota bacterium]
MNKFAVIGLGRFGTRIALSLAEKGAEVLAIDSSPEKVETIKDDVAYAVCLDSTDLKALQAHDIEKMDAVIVAIGENFEALLLTAAQLKELKIKRLITRSSSQTQTMILKQMGITEMLSPEAEVGLSLAQRLLNPDMLTFFDLPDGYQIVEILAPHGIINKSLTDIGLRERYHLNLITIKREFEEIEKGEVLTRVHTIGVPKANTTIFEGDLLIIMGKQSDIQQFIEINR